MTTCLVLSPDLDRYCGQPATHKAGPLPCCDDCAEYLLHNEWPFYMERLDHAADAARKGIERDGE